MLWKKCTFRSLFISLLALMMLSVAGCGGCRDDASASKKKKDKKKVRKPDYERLDAVVMPGVFTRPEAPDQYPDETEVEKSRRLAKERMARIASNKAKLGHWLTTSYPAIANHFNGEGVLSGTSVDALSKSLAVPDTDYFISTTRPVSLPKGEWKYLESSIFLPRRESRVSNANVIFQLNSGGASVFPRDANVFSLLKSHQYQFVILSNKPDAWGYVSLLDVVGIPGDETTGESIGNFYNVVRNRVGDPLPLPRNALNWTTIAYILWDDIAAEDLDPDQQMAMLDWIHQGGQLIISGPDALDKIQSGFLADYLPAKFDSSFNLGNDDIAPLNTNWSVPVTKNPLEKRDLVLLTKSPLLGVKFAPNPDARYVDGTGELVIERRVGRGRIVVSAFSLDDPPIKKWRSLNSFYNGCLLRRPARRFGLNDEGMQSFEWNSDPSSIFDPLLGSSLRILSRDLGVNGTGPRHQYSHSEAPMPDWRGMMVHDQTPETKAILRDSKNKGENRNRDNVWRYGGYNDDIQSGTAGWNDASGISIAARTTLKEAAGITPPSSGFVLKMLALYLLVLVPINWLLFKLIGRVEWAWIAAPIIAIAGAVVVVRMASLDIGFVRNNTQVGVVEAYAGYPRAHSTEYSALYTSLSTNYDVQLDNTTAQSLPFATELEERFKPKQKALRVNLNRSRDIRLEDFQVQSNTTGMLHTEFMVDMSGAFVVREDSGITLLNGTRYNLRSAGVIKRVSKDLYQVAWIGEFNAGTESGPLTFEFADSKQAAYEAWQQEDGFLSTNRKCEKIWTKNLSGSPERVTTCTVSALLSFPEFTDRLPLLRTAIQRTRKVDSIEEIESEGITFSEFVAIYPMIDSAPEINVGRLFDVVSDTLELEIGELRMLAATKDAVGRTEFRPESTQTDRQTLFVVHLKKGSFPTAERDTNSRADLDIKSNLDLLNSSPQPDEVGF